MVNSSWTQSSRCMDRLWERGLHWTISKNERKQVWCTSSEHRLWTRNLISAKKVRGLFEIEEYKKQGNSYSQREKETEYVECGHHIGLQMHMYHRMKFWDSNRQ